MKPEEEDIEAIRKRCEAATPGPWSYDFWEEYVYVSLDSGLFIVADLKRASQMDRDGDFIAHARQDIPTLLSALEAARAKLADAEDHIRYQADANSALFKQSQEYWQDRENAAKLLESAQAKLAEVEKARDTWEHALKCRDRQFREFMNKWEEATEFTDTLKEKLALCESAQEENRRLREAAIGLMNSYIRLAEKADATRNPVLHDEVLYAHAVYKIKQALARPEKEEV